MSQWIRPVTLQGELITLRPLELADVNALYEAGRYSEIWKWTADNAGSSRDAMQHYVETALKNHAAGLDFPFVHVLNSTGRLIGSTRFQVTADLAVEIGWTWITPEFQRTRVNTEAKFLMLRHAFEELGCLRVQLKTDDRNVVSQAAIQRIGARFEGVLRSSQTCWDGHRRDTHMFSIIASEWPSAKAALMAKLGG
jgi:RimJ/RimL family protein N-acetyltransferase